MPPTQPSALLTLRFFGFQSQYFFGRWRDSFGLWDKRSQWAGSKSMAKSTSRFNMDGPKIRKWSLALQESVVHPAGLEPATL
jgi:hypothetical protein